MFFSTFALLLLATSSALAADHAVTVGKDSTGASALAYSPESVVAAAGDTVTFTFPGTTHTATLSSFAMPCTAISDASAFNVGGTAGSYAYNVTSDKPVWFYCKTGSHCASGMVFAINPTTNKTYAAFKATAMGATAPTTGGTNTTSSNTTTSTPSSTKTSTTTGSAGRGVEIAGGLALVLSLAVAAMGV